MACTTVSWNTPKNGFSRVATHHSPLTSGCLPYLVVEMEMENGKWKMENGKQKTSVICTTETTTNQTGRRIPQDQDDGVGIDVEVHDDDEDAGPLDC